MLVYYVLWIFTWLWTVANQIQKKWIKIDYIFYHQKNQKRRQVFLWNPQMPMVGIFYKSGRVWRFVRNAFKHSIL